MLIMLIFNINLVRHLEKSRLTILKKVYIVIIPSKLYIESKNFGFQETFFIVTRPYFKI